MYEAVILYKSKEKFFFSNIWSKTFKIIQNVINKVDFIHFKIDIFTMIPLLN